MTLIQSRLKELLDYCPDTGRFVWKVPRGGLARVNTVAGAIKTGGYRQIMIDKKMYLAHKLAWFYVYGVFPSALLDHINRRPDDNSIKNLREATQKQNRENLNLAKNNTSGRTAVFWVKRTKRWQAKIGHNGQKIHLGYFGAKEEAIAAVRNAEAKYFTHRGAF